MKEVPLSILVFTVTIITLLSACSTISLIEIKSDEHLGETVTLTGIVEKSIKIGDFSGYTLRDKDNNTIGVSSKSLPAEGTTVTITGVVMKDSLFGYYILVKE